MTIDERKRTVVTVLRGLQDEGTARQADQKWSEREESRTAGSVCDNQSWTEGRRNAQRARYGPACKTQRKRTLNTWLQEQDPPGFASCSIGPTSTSRAARADEALASVEGVWRRGTPVDVRDRAGVFHTARHVAYCARTTVPEDEEMALYRALVAGLADRYEVPRTRRPGARENAAGRRPAPALARAAMITSNLHGRMHRALT